MENSISNTNPNDAPQTLSQANDENVIMPESNLALAIGESEAVMKSLNSTGYLIQEIKNDGSKGALHGLIDGDEIVFDENNNGFLVGGKVVDTAKARKICDIYKSAIRHYTAEDNS
ncbi:MAG: hypothetical protein AAB840_01040 [Patescibacteria group bacterium]